MSAQQAASPSRSKSLIERVLREPNAIWLREMRQSARIGRTPWILFGLTLTIALLMCSIGGLAASNEASPAKIGNSLFQVFFSLAYLVVVVAGPAVAANSVASEREGRTWEAILLTGLTPKKIARGKFMAAYTTVSLYIVILAPVGALSFLFGGVTATEVVVAFAFLFLLAGLAVAFGLAVSSLVASMRLAIVLTLLLAICVGPLLYFFLGFGLSFGAHELWSEVPQGHPVWLPLAYTRAELGAEYVLFLVVIPILLVALPAWFLYEASISNLSGEADDRSSGMKRWFIVTLPLLALACAAPSVVMDDTKAKFAFALVGMTLFVLFAGFSALLFVHEPPGPSRRVRVHWQRESAGRMRRFLGPGLPKTAMLVIALGVFGILAIAAVDILSLGRSKLPRFASIQAMQEQLFFFAAYAAPFFVFLVGFASWVRARGSTPWITRIIVVAVVTLIFAGPWVVAAIGGVLTNGRGDGHMIIGAPSPIFVISMMKAVDSNPSGAPIVLVGVTCALGWGLLGLVFLSLATKRCSRAIAQYDAAVGVAEAALAAEDAQIAANAAAPAADPVPDGPAPEAAKPA